MKNKRMYIWVSIITLTAILFSSFCIPGLFVFANEKPAVWDGSKSAPTQGKGTESQPYLITNGAELAFAVTNCDERYFKLTEDIYLNDVSDKKWYEKTEINHWKSGSFQGHLNGDGHVVYGIYVNTDEYNDDGYGLINKLQLNSTVKNLGVANSYLRAGGDESYVGAIVGTRSWIEDKNAYISGCFAAADVQLKGVTVGGIIGFNSKSKLVVSDCYSLASIDADSYGGGIIGDQCGRLIEVKNCYANQISYGKEDEEPVTSDSYFGDNINQASMQGTDVFTNSAKMPKLNSSGAFIATEGYPVLKAFVEIEETKYKISEIPYKSQGRVAVKDGVLLLNQTGSGIEFISDCKGEVKVTFTADVKDTSNNGGLYYTVFVDGNIQSENRTATGKYPYRITQSGEQEQIVISGIDSGRHSIGIFNQSDASAGTLGIKDITVKGTFIDGLKPNDLYIEFVGDETVTGCGNLAISTNQTPKYTDFFRQWSYITAQTMSSDWSIVGTKGLTVTTGDNSAQTAYPLQMYSADKTTVYDFTRQPDVVVVSLGDNDVASKTAAEIKTGVKQMASLIRSKNANAKIVWVYGFIKNFPVESVTEALSELGGKAKGYYSVDVSSVKTGSNLSKQQKYADKVADCLEIVLGYKSENPGKIWDGKKTQPTAGKGTKEEPYLISDGAQLAWAVVNKGGYYFKLIEDIYLNDVSGAQWFKSKRLNTWIGNEFFGNLDGDGHVVYGIYINTSEIGNYGLISRLTLNSTVKNIGVASAYINAPGSYVGGIAGERSYHDNQDAEISCCYIAEDVTMYGYVVGGIIGCNTCSLLNIRNCYCLADLSAMEYVGGIVGDLYSRKIVVENCYATMPLSVKEKDSLIRSNCYEVSGDFTVDKMKGKDVFSSFAKMPFLNSAKEYLSNEGFPILRVFTDDPTQEDTSGISVEKYEQGIGTKDDPYLISKDSHLRYLVSDANTSGKYYRLTADIYVNDTTNNNWLKDTPKPWYIYEDGMPLFRGVFDGNGHSVHGLYTESVPSTEDNIANDGCGLFPLVAPGAVIKNVHIRDSVITAAGFAGSLVGLVYGNEDVTKYCTIIGCSADETVSVKGFAAGGLVGGGERGVEIYYSYFTGKLKASGENRANALVGDMWGTEHKAAQCYTANYNNYREDFYPNSYSDIYTTAPQEKTITVSMQNMLGTSAKNNMSLLDWNYWETVEGKTPHPKVIEADRIEYFFDEGVKDRVWSGKLATKYAGGSGTENDPYLIETPEQLAFFVNSTVGINSDMAGKYYKLTADIKLNDTSADKWENNALQWFSGEYYFNGHFDGAGHVVSGLYYKGSSDTVGLFPYVLPSSTVKRLGVTKSTIIAENSSVPTYAAAIAGASVHRTYDNELPRVSAYFEQCFADDSVHIKASSPGGIVCYVSEPVNVKDCYFTGKLTYDGECGGIIGNTWEEGNYIENCYCATEGRETGVGNVGWKVDVKNLYVDGPLNDVKNAEMLNLKAMFGKNAITWMQGFDFENVWETVEDGTPVLRVFNNKKYSCKREPSKVAIEFLALEGSKCDTIYGYPRFTKISKLPTPTRYGYTFGGWYYYRECDLPFDLEYFPDFSIFLYPKWISNGFVVDFENTSFNTEYDINGAVQQYKPGVAGYDMAYIHGGSKSLWTKGGNLYKPAFLLNYQNKLEVGKKYEIRFWMMSDTANASGDINLIYSKYPDVHDETFAVEKGLSFKCGGQNEWKEYTLSFTAAAGYLILQLPDNADYYLDDFQVIFTGKDGTITAKHSKNALDETIDTEEYFEEESADEDVDEDVGSENVINSQKKRKKIRKKVVSNDTVAFDTTAIILIAVGAVVVIAGTTVLIILMKKRKKKQKGN